MAQNNNNNRAADGKENSALIEKALQGKVSFTDFRAFVTNYVGDHNQRVQANLVGVTFSKIYLDFELINGLLPVVGFKDEKTWRTDSITLMNSNKKHKLYFYIDPIKSPKYDMVIEPKEGCVKKGNVVHINFKLRVFCTTRIYQIAKIYLYHGNPMKTAKVWWPTKPQEKKYAENPHVIYVSFRIESELSTSFDYDDLELGQQLAKGGFGTVYKAKWRGTEVAVKMLSQDMVPEEQEQVEREISLMSKLNSQYIVTFMGATKIPSYPTCIVMEFVEEGSLKKLIKKSLDFSFKVKLAVDIIKGLTFLHTNNIAHRDLKPDNVLVVSPHKMAHVNVKLTDFGTSRADASYSKPLIDNNILGKTSATKLLDKRVTNKTLSHEEVPHSVTRNMTKGVGTLIYSAPEILAGESDYDTQKTDIYSFGVLLWELFLQKEPYGEPPMDKWKSREIAEFVIRGKRLEIPNSMNPEIAALIKSCWSQKPSDRPPCAEIAKKLDVILADKPEPLPIEVQSLIGWFGEIERDEAESDLRETANGTFIFRYSKKQSSFVLSYRDDTQKGKPFSHISGITQNKNDLKVVVKTTTGFLNYNSFLDYVEAMKKNKIITEPLKSKPIVESYYGVTTTAPPSINTSVLTKPRTDSSDSRNRNDSSGSRGRHDSSDKNFAYAETSIRKDSSSSHSDHPPEESYNESYESAARIKSFQNS